MDFLRRIIDQIKGQLGGLGVSQKLVIGLLLVIMLGSISMMVDYASQRERVPLLNTSFTQEQSQRILLKLDTWGTSYELKGDQIWVSKSEHKALIAKLGYEQVLPEDTSAGWSILLDDNNVWASETTRLNKKRIVLQMELARAMGSWPGVSKALVFINDGGKRRLDNVTPGASASVTLETQGALQDVTKLAMTTASFVSGAVDRLRPENVQVIVNGRNVPVVSPGGEVLHDYIGKKEKFERLYQDKIVMALPPGIGAVVVVNVKVKNDKEEIRTLKIPGEDDGSWNPEVEATGREETSSTADSPKEPGMMANTGSGGSAGTKEEQSTEETTTTKQPYPGRTETILIKGIGDVEEVTATVMIPDAYFEVLAKKGDAAAKPDATVVAAVMAAELAKFKQVVMLAIGLESPQDDLRVSVTNYSGGPMMATGGGDWDGSGESGASESNIAGLVFRYGKHIAVSALALISLFMVLMMVRKSAGPVDLTKEEVSGLMSVSSPTDALGLEDSHISDDEETDGLLSGMEMDDNSIRSQQILQQIREMVKKSPDTATDLVSRWMNREK